MTRKVAHLARLHLTDDEVDRYTRQIADVLTHVEALSEVNTEGVEPLLHPHDMEIPLRDDEVHAFAPAADGQPKVLKSAPDVIHDGYRVPQIL